MLIERLVAYVVVCKNTVDAICPVVGEVCIGAAMEDCALGQGMSGMCEYVSQGHVCGQRIGVVD